MQADAEDHAKFAVCGTASAYLLRAMKINPVPAGFVERSWGVEGIADRRNVRSVRP